MFTTAAASFLGHAPRWYSGALLALLALNVLLWLTAGAVITAWAIVLEFIFTLAMALKCYPLAPGGLIAIQAVLLGLATPAQVYAETVNGFPVILLLIFMVTAIYFMRELLLYVFSRVLTVVRSQTVLALLFCLVAAVLSAFLDALTVLAVIITVALGFYRLYFKVASGSGELDPQHLSQDAHLPVARQPGGRVRPAHDGGHGGDHGERDADRRHRAGRAPRLRARQHRRDDAVGEVRAALALPVSPAANVSGSGSVRVVSCLGARSGRVPSTEREPPA